MITTLCVLAWAAVVVVVGAISMTDLADRDAPIAGEEDS